MFPVGEIPGVVDVPDQGICGGKAAGRVYAAGRILADPQVGAEFIVLLLVSGKNEQDLFEVRFTDLQVSMPGNVCIDPDQAAAFEFSDMRGQGPVG